MVVGDHQPHPGGTRGHHVGAAGAAVDRDHATGPPAGEVVEGRSMEPVPLGHPVGDVGDDLRPPGAQRDGEHGAGGDTVRVVVAVHRDGRPLLDGDSDADDRLGHAGKSERVVPGPLVREQRRRRRGVVPAGGEDSAQERRHPRQWRRLGDLPASGRGPHRVTRSVPSGRARR